MSIAQNRLKPDDYRDLCWQRVQDYVEGVSNGDIIVGEYIKKVVQRYKDMLLQKDKYIYKTDKVDKVFMFFSFLNIEHKNQYVQLDLLPWQAFIISFIFGFYRADNEQKRVIREALIFCARKNGKTAFASSLQLYGMLGDGVINPQSLLLANTTQQATVALNFAKNMVVHTPELNKRLAGQRSRIIFKDYNKQGFCQIFSPVDSARLEGHSPSFAILDEAHGYENNSIYAAIKTGTGARINPLLLIISTAGSKINGFLNEHLQYNKNILDGKIEDDSMIAFIYQIDPTDDMEDSSTWCKSNPSLNVINSLEDLELMYNTAKHSYADRFAFVTKHLNIFWDTPDVWIPEDVLREVFMNFDIEKLYGKDCYMGMDLSRTTDLTSIVLIFPPTEDDNMFYVLPFFFMANRADNILRKNGKDLTDWIRKDYIIKHESKVIDLNNIYDKVIELSQLFNIISISYDRYNAPQLVSRLQEYGLFCVNFEQNARRFNAPLKYLESLVYEKGLKVYNNPCMLWNWNNVILYIDTNANIKIMKNKQNDSVDGVVALAMALGGYLDGKFGQEITGLRTYMNNSQ